MPKNRVGTLGGRVRAGLGSVGAYLYHNAGIRRTAATNPRAPAQRLARAAWYLLRPSRSLSQERAERVHLYILARAAW